jgi:hypothetical protein
MPCTAGFYCSGSPAERVICPAGRYCMALSAGSLPCPGGNFCASGSSTPAPCDVGTYCPASSPVPITCPAGNICWAGSTSMTPCTAGYYCTESANIQVACPVAFYCPLGSAQALACPVDMTSSSPRVSDSDCICTPAAIANPVSVCSPNLVATPRQFVGRVCVCAVGLEISLPCNTRHDVECSAVRRLDWGEYVETKFHLRLPGIDSGVGFDEWFFRGAIAEMFEMDFREVLVDDVRLM